MHRMLPLWACCLLWATSNGLSAEAGFVPLFKRNSLEGWVNANCAPETWSIKDGVVHCTGKPTGAMRTSRQYENFILEAEWRHLSSGGNSGVFIWGTPIAAPGVPFLRGIEVQVLDHGYNSKGKTEWYTTHGDVFPIHGATMIPFGRHNGQRSFPSEDRSKGSPEWNHYRIQCTNGVLRLSVNGKEVSGGEECVYRKGYLALESEGAPVEFRNVQIKELPASGAPAEKTAPEDIGFRTLFTGLDFRGWKTNETASMRWEIRGERIVLKEGSPVAGATLWTDKQFGNADFVVDCRPSKPKSETSTVVPSVFIRGENGKGHEIKLEGAEADKYSRFVITVQGRSVVIRLHDKETQRFELPGNTAATGSFGLRDNGAPLEFMNLYSRATH